MIKHYFSHPVCLLFVLILAASCNGQSAKHSVQAKLVRTQGTDQYDQVRCGAQDKAGDLWFGTTGEGVYRYNGKAFTQYTTKHGLSGNKVWSILSDKAGNLWFGTDSGLCRYDGKTFIPVPLAAGGAPSDLGNFAYSAQSAQPTVWDIFQDKSGMLWLGTTQGIYCYNGVSFTRFLDQQDIINKDHLTLTTIGQILEDKQGKIWFVSSMPAGGDGLCRYDPVSHELVSFRPGDEIWIRHMVEDRNGILWLGTRHLGNWRYDGQSFTHYAGKEGLGAPAILDKAGNIWFMGEEHSNGYGGQGGVWRYDGKTFTNFTTKDGMGDYGVWCIIEDRDGNIWFGTRNMGLYRYDGKTFTGFSE